MKRANWRALGAAAVTGMAISLVWLLAAWFARPEGPVPITAIAARFWWAILFSLVGSALLSLVLDRWSERRDARLRSSLERLAEGQPWVRMQPDGSPATKRMAHVFNRLAEYVETTQHDLEQSISELERGLTGKARQLEQANRVLLDVANRDPLTQLANRARLEVEIERHVPLARNSGLPLAVVMLDLDHFKDYNDAVGHLAGDQLLIRVADAMRSRARATDLISRWGGDEFCVLLPGTSPRGAQSVALGLVEAVSEAMNQDLPDNLFVDIGASAGFACFPDDGDDAATLIALADGALYMAKASGRGRVLRAGDDPSDPG
jgi:diguanylate cyclase (GGDEF)-like protein